MIQIGEVYRVYGHQGAYTDIQIHSVTDEVVRCQRLSDDEIVAVNRRWLEGHRNKIRLDQAAVYGQDCIDGRCEM